MQAGYVQRLQVHDHEQCTPITLIGYELKQGRVACLAEMGSRLTGKQDGGFNIDVQDLVDCAVWHVKDEARSGVDGRIGDQRVHAAPAAHCQLHKPRQILLAADVGCAANRHDARGMQLCQRCFHILLHGMQHSQKSPRTSTDNLRYKGQR